MVGAQCVSIPFRSGLGLNGAVKGGMSVDDAFQSPLDRGWA